MSRNHETLVYLRRVVMSTIHYLRSGQRPSDEKVRQYIGVLDDVANELTETIELTECKQAELDAAVTTVEAETNPTLVEFSDEQHNTHMVRWLNCTKCENEFLHETGVLNPGQNFPPHSAHDLRE